MQPAAVSIPENTADLVRSAYLSGRSCAGCYSDNLAGKEYFNGPALGAIPAPNQTAGRGGNGGTYSDTDFVRAIRLGVGTEGEPIMLLPYKASLKP